MVKIVVAVATLGEPCSGDFVRETYVRKCKKKKLYKQMDHVLVILKNNYDELESYMSRLSFEQSNTIHHY